MHRIPDKPEGVKEEQISRIQKMRDDLGDPAFVPPMPPVNLPLLLDYFDDVGPAASDGMGPAPLSYVLIRAWRKEVGLKLPPWQVQILRMMSVAYCDESYRAAKLDAPPPWGETSTTEVDPMVHAKRLKAKL